MTDWLKKQLEFASESRRELPNWMEKNTNIFKARTSVVISINNQEKHPISDHNSDSLNRDSNSTHRQNLK